MYIVSYTKIAIWCPNIQSASVILKAVSNGNFVRLSHSASLLPDCHGPENAASIIASGDLPSYYLLIVTYPSTRGCSGAASLLIWADQMASIFQAAREKLSFHTFGCSHCQRKSELVLLLLLLFDNMQLTLVALILSLKSAPM